MDMEFLEAGQIINTHGVRGEVKIDPWADSPDFLTNFDVFYIDGVPYPVISCRVHQRFVIAKLKGVDTMERAEAMKNKIICLDRDAAPHFDDRFYVAEIIGYTAIDDRDRKVIGKITDIIETPAGEICEIHGDREILIPLVGEFIVSIDNDASEIVFHLIEGM